MDNGASSYRRFLDGNDDGLAELVRDYKDGLILYLNSFVNDIYMAEELMEETFFKIITRRPRFRAKYSFKTWLYTIARNVALDYLRRSSIISTMPVDEAEDKLKDECNLEQSYIVEERKIAVHRGLKRLNPDYRQILWLMYFEELNCAEAGAVMKKNSRQIKNLVYRAKKALKEELDKEGFVYEEL